VDNQRNPKVDIESRPPLIEAPVLANQALLTDAFASARDISNFAGAPVINAVDFGQSAASTDDHLVTAITAHIALNGRPNYGLDPQATAEDQLIAEDAYFRGLYGISATAPAEELAAARTAWYGKITRLFYGLPGSATESELAEAKAQIGPDYAERVVRALDECWPTQDGY